MTNNNIRMELIKLLKDNGKSRHYKKIKCSECRNLVEIIPEDIIKYEGISYYECPFCGYQILLKEKIN